jgi:hypothetical protein
MKTLKTEIKHEGRTLRQIKRDAMVALYEVRGAGNALYGYEVIKIKIAPAEVIMDKMYPEREVYPSSRKNSDDWGSIAWSYGCNDKNRALARYNGLVKASTLGAVKATETDLEGSEYGDSGQ